MSNHRSKPDTIHRISPRIRKAYSTLRPAEKRVADFFLSRPSYAMSLSARELGGICKTSEATVVRFCQNLGYKGLIDFRAEISKEVSRLERQAFLSVDSNDGPDDIISKSVTHGTDLLRSLVIALDPKEFYKAFSKIAHAESVLLYGAGGSA